MEEKKLYNIDWELYLQPKRQRQSGTQATIGWDSRNQFESDLGRVIFCPAIRRMHDKTQVIPLTSGDTILTRLTHSMQVMSVAESLAHYYTRSESFLKLYGDKAYQYDASISAILRTAALLHDIGNPPFGHFGEITIQNYFKKYLEDHHIIKERQAWDFTQFDGNALGLRMVSKLQYGEALLMPYLKDPKNPLSFSIEKLIGFNRLWKDGTEKDKRRLILDFRVALIGYLTKLAIDNFEKNLDNIDKGEYSNELLKDDEYEVFGALSDFAYHRIISKRDIQEVELTGNSVINGLLDILMSYAFSEDKKFRSKIKAVISKSRMEVTLHENKYVGVDFKLFNDEDLWDFDIEQLDNYSKLRLIVDFVASMTDKYSVELYQKFAGMRM